MLKSVHKTMDKLGKSFVQVLDLCALSTGRLFNGLRFGFLYRFNNTAPAQETTGFAQPVMPVFNLLVFYLYPFSTVPITNTKLNIKELYS
jgi:hypothetical protein